MNIYQATYQKSLKLLKLVEGWVISAIVWRMLALVVASLFLLPAVQASPVPGNTIISTQATAEYIPNGYAQNETIYSERIYVTVASVEVVLLTPTTQTVNAAPSTTAILRHVLTNGGNVTSQYTFSLQSNASGCQSTTMNLSGLQLVRDINGNGVAESSDAVVPLSTPGALSLAMGESANLLVTGGVAASQSGLACLQLKTTTTVQGSVASALDTVRINNAAVITVNKSATYSGVVQPGTSVVRYTVTANNVGVNDAVGTNISSTSNTILINGVAQSYVLIRDVIPTGVTYVYGSLKSATTGAVRLFRLPGDPLFSYRTEGHEDASAMNMHCSKNQCNLRMFYK